MPQSPTRDRALDGLRGVAALVVVTGHVLVSSVPLLANGILTVDTTDVSAPYWLLLYTPLHAFWAGAEAVVVFFVLSGYVLTLPVARGGVFRPASYYPHRLLRLYVPVWGALVFAAVAHFAVEGSGGGGTWWLDAHTRGLGLEQVKESFFLLHGAGDYSLLAVLWSLHWEVVFSLLLPLFLLFGWATRRFVWVAAAAVLAILCFRGLHEWARYLPAFALGALMAFQHSRFSSLRGRLAVSGAGVVELVLFACAVVGLTAGWWLRVGDHALVGHSADLDAQLAPLLVAVGACAALGLALVGPSARRVLETRPLQWAGTRSYSLYLVHEPVLVAIAFALGGAPSLPLLALVAVPLALLVTEAFHRAIERPSHELARRAGRLAGGVEPERSRAQG
jgi:peptidoglycan/LPS O-acetylase OafA/YrhL